jgi:hypothetical protein
VRNVSSKSEARLCFRRWDFRYSDWLGYQSESKLILFDTGQDKRDYQRVHAPVNICRENVCFMIFAKNEQHPYLYMFIQILLNYNNEHALLCKKYLYTRMSIAGSDLGRKVMNVTPCNPPILEGAPMFSSSLYCYNDSFRRNRHSSPPSSKPEYR